MTVFYTGGYLSQLIQNFIAWKQSNPIPSDGSLPAAASYHFLDCIKSALDFPGSIAGVLFAAFVIGAMIAMLIKAFAKDSGEFDSDRNFIYSSKGTYGTSGWMTPHEMKEVLELVPYVHKYKGIILGLRDGKAVCVPPSSMLNSNLAV